MNIQLEREVLESIIFKPSVIKDIEINDRWFRTREHNEIMRAVFELDGHVESLNQLLLEVKQINPLSKVTIDYLEAREEARMTVVNIEREAKELKLEYLNDFVNDKARKMAEQPTKKNRDLLENALAVLNEARADKDDGTIFESIAEMDNRFKYDDDSRIKTMLNLNKATNGGLRNKQFIVIAAATGGGKTAYSLNVVYNAMLNEKDILIDYYTLEMDKVEVLERLVSLRSRVNLSKVEQPKKLLKDEQEIERVKEAQMFFMEQNIRIFDGIYYEDEIIRMIRKRKKEAEETGKKYLPIIDYLGLMEMKGNVNSPYEKTTRITRNIKKATNELKQSIIVLSQFNRELDKRQSKRPMLSDLRDSGSVAQDANLVMFVWQEEDSDKTLLSIAKNRSGGLVDLEYKFVKNKMLFVEV